MCKMIELPESRTLAVQISDDIDDKTIMNKKYLLSTERIHLFTPNINIVMKVDIGGKPEIDKLIQAIDDAVRANESLNCKITLSKNGEAGYERLEKPKYFVEVSNKNWMEITREQESRMFQISSGELVRFYILTSGSDVGLLVIAHHLAGDGLSVAYLIEDIMRALVGDTLEFKSLQLASVDSLPQKSKITSIMKLLLNGLNSKWRRNGKVFTYSDYEEMFEDYWKDRKTTLYSQQLSQINLESLCKKAKEFKVSLNSLIATTFIRAYGNIADTGLAVSSREKENRTMANFASGIAFQYSYNKNKSMCKNAQKIHKRIYKKLGNDKKKYLVLQFIGMMEPTLIDSACMTIYGNYKNKTTNKITHIMGYDNNPKDISITNLTKLDIAVNYGEYNIKNFVFVAPIIPNARRVIGIVTLGNEMCITMHVMDDEKVDNEKRIFEKAIQILKSIE